MIYTTVKVLKLGTMGPSSIRVSSKKAKRQALEDSNSMEIIMREISMMASSKDRELITLQTVENFIKVNSQKIILLDMVA